MSSEPSSSKRDGLMSVYVDGPELAMRSAGGDTLAGGRYTPMS